MKLLEEKSFRKRKLFDKSGIYKCVKKNIWKLRAMVEKIGGIWRGRVACGRGRKKISEIWDDFESNLESWGLTA